MKKTVHTGDGGQARRNWGNNPRLDVTSLSFEMQSLLKDSEEKLYQVTCDVRLDPVGLVSDTVVYLPKARTVNPQKP
jgi:hypothetical protein